MTAKSVEVVDVVTPYSPEHTSKSQLERAKKSVEKQEVETNHIVVEDSEQNGPAWARNKGLESSDNRFVAFLDADDYWKQGKLSKQLHSLKSSNKGISITDAVNKDGENSLPTFAGDKITNEESVISQLILGGVKSVTSSILVDTRQLEGKRFDESYYRFEDHEYVFSCFNESGLTVISDDLVVVEKTASGLSANTDRLAQIESRILLLKEKQISLNQDFSGAFDQALAKQYRWLARERLRTGDSSELVDLYRKSLSTYPLPKTFAAMVLDLPKGVVS